MVDKYIYLFNIYKYNLIFTSKFKFFYCLKWGLGIGDWGLGSVGGGGGGVRVGYWAQTPNPNSQIPNPQSPIPILNKKNIIIYIYL